MVRSLISLYRALGGGWQAHDAPYVDDVTREEMEERIDWDDKLDITRHTARNEENSGQ